MKNIVTIITILLGICFTYAQDDGFDNNQPGFNNQGNMKMHNDSKIGFHMQMKNDGALDNENINTGERFNSFAGFYHETDYLVVDGTNRPVFGDVDVAVDNNLYLFNSLGITNNFLFLTGKVITDKDDKDVSLDYINYNWHDGEDDDMHVDGYVTNIGNDEFRFPIGEDDRLREMILPAQSGNQFYEGAYFYLNPEDANNYANTFQGEFLREEKYYRIEVVSPYEFWDLNGTNGTRITLTWDVNSGINFITEELSKLVVVGWNIERERWENLGRTAITGDFDEGEITSESFTPDDYEIITFGAFGVERTNYHISPDGDDYNETLVFNELADFNESELIIFNRWGNVVYRATNYQNDFSGISNVKTAIAKSTKLPVGTYFYQLKFGNDGILGDSKKGWVYINRKAK